MKATYVGIVPRGTIWADEIGNLEAEGQFGLQAGFCLGCLSFKIVPRGTILGGVGAGFPNRDLNSRTPRGGS
jgi:hypothetical protein